MANPDLTGMIFKSEGKEYRSSPVVTTFWLITGPERNGSYPTVKCSATGKTYKSTNGFSAKSMLELQRSKKLDYRHSDAGTLYSLVREPGNYECKKADIETSTKITALKNRINYLEGEIQYATKELAKAKATLEHLEMWKKGDVDDGTMHFGVSSSLLKD